MSAAESNRDGARPPVQPPLFLARHAAHVLSEMRNAFSGKDLGELGKGLEEQLASGGKGLRPALCLWLAELLGCPLGDAMPFAVAVEMLHNAFLIHDDIEDGDEFRRDCPALWARFGIPIALNVADLLHAESWRSVARTPRDDHCRAALFEVFADTFRTTVEGQALDLEGRADPSFTLERYEEIIRKKTGRYLALGWVGAALIAGWEPERARAFWAVGDHLGPAFQIRDDLLDLTTGKGRGGEVGCDIREGKPSILFAHALCSADLEEKQRCRLLEILGRPRDETGPDDVAWVIELYRLLGSLEFAAQEARRRAARGIDAFCSLEGIPAAGARPIEEIAAYLSERGA